MKLVGDESAKASAVAEISPPSRWTRRLRRVRSRPLRDPLALSVLALSSALLAIGLGVGMLFADRVLAGGTALVVATVFVSFYTAIALRAFKRDRAVRYWLDRRDLRLALARKEAHISLHGEMIEAVRKLDEVGGPSRAQAMLCSIVDGVYATISRITGADAAVILALESNRRHRILRAATSKRSRWDVLESGKDCPADQPLEEKLAGLAQHHRTCEITTMHGDLRLIVLSEAALELVGDRLFVDLTTCLHLLAVRWAPPNAPASRRIALVR